MSRIVVALDGSEQAERAFHEAMQLAEKAGSSVYLLYIAQRYVSVGQDDEILDQLLQQAERYGKGMLEKYSDLAESKYGIKVETILARGYPSKAIIDIAKERDVDLIVVGSRGLGGVKELFLGSVSSAVVRNSKVPVLVVK